MSDEIVFPYEKGRVVVLLDDREAGGECASRLQELGAVLLEKRLPVADFVCSERVGIERKTASDFESSVVDGRLFQQARELSSNFASPLLAIVGRDFQRLEKKARRGAFISLAVDSRLPLFFLENEHSLAEFIYAVGFREQLKPLREEKLRFEKRFFDASQTKQFVVEGLPGVGPALAKQLLEHFGSVENVFTADEEELTQVPGIGGEKAKRIRKLVVGDYFEEEKKVGKNNNV